MSTKIHVGRPASTEQRKFISGFFLPKFLVEKLEKICKKRELTKTEFFREIIEKEK